MEQTNKQIYTYDYDEQGVRCRFSEEGGWEPIEPHCLNCGYKTDECDCGEFEEAWYAERDTCYADGTDDCPMCAVFNS